MKSSSKRVVDGNENPKKLPSFILFLSLFDEQSKRFLVEWPYLVFTQLKEDQVREEALQFLEQNQNFKKNSEFKMQKSSQPDCFWGLIKSENGISLLSLFANLDHMNVAKQYLIKVRTTFSSYETFSKKNLKTVQK